jgi:hypothetical protein
MRKVRSGTRYRTAWNDSRFKLLGLLTLERCQGHDEALETRGADAMGFDQDATTHHFNFSPTGGSSEVTVKAPGGRAGDSRGSQPLAVAHPLPV